MCKVLTIAVPTYNRAEMLKYCMERLLIETEGRPIEILVSDNASTDDTNRFMKELCITHPEVSYIRNSENVGPDRNFLNCYERASGEYVLLLGDDDILLPGAVDEILEALMKKPVFVHLNTSNLQSVTPLAYSKPRVSEGQAREYYSRDDLMKDMGVFVTFVSALVLRTDLVRAIPDKEQYFGTYFLQSHIALKTIVTEGLYLFVTKNCVAATGNITVNYDVYYVWGAQYGKLLLNTAVDAGVNPDVIRCLHKHDLKTIIYSFVKNFRMTCSQSCEWDKTYMVESIRPYPELYLRYLLIMNLPLWILKLARKIVRKIKNCFGRWS